MVRGKIMPTISKLGRISLRIAFRFSFYVSEGVTVLSFIYLFHYFINTFTTIKGENTQDFSGFTPS